MSSVSITVSVHHIKEMAEGVRDGEIKIKFVQFRGSRGTPSFATSSSSPGGLDCGTMAAMGTLEQELQKIYDSEINLSISWMWDAGFDLKLGDEFGGFVEEGQVRGVADILPWFQEAIAKHYPTSQYQVERTGGKFTPQFVEPIAEG